MHVFGMMVKLVFIGNSFFKDGASHDIIYLKACTPLFYTEKT